jgi:hypothetical protein
MPRFTISGWQPRVVAAVGLGAIWLHFHVGHDREKTIEFAAALLGGLAAIYALFLNVHASRVTAAARFIERWNDTRFDPYRAIWAQIIETKKIPWTKPEELRPVRVVLNFFEEMGISVNRKEADEELLKDFFLSLACDVFSATKHWIDQRRKHNPQPTLYEHFYKMATRWETQRRR